MQFPRGVLYPKRQEPHVQVAQHPPGAGLEAFAEYFWHVRWTVAEPYDTEVLNHPNVHLVFEEPRPLVYGVERSRFVRRLSGTGQVLGLRFRPGGFRCLIDGPVSALADRRTPAAEIFGPGIDALNATLLASDDRVDLARDFLTPFLPGDPDPSAVHAAEIVHHITDNPGLFTVEDLAAKAGVSVRTLQRLFTEYVGATPKWVIRRARLHEAAARADSGTPVDWPALATDLGYADQSHLTRDFTTTIGKPPTHYTST
ncbi:AraC family transcriptional regulator [Actinomadura flavalba]|uniref:AraC family transcriptional regulator n=1 Tax=Actinomadura flavalba TaxID=1120938 RepID=UPI00035E8FC1|nr:helix-turn-helix domain-containing protein [Actinomadura flavalba]